MTQEAAQLRLEQRKFKQREYQRAYEERTGRSGYNSEAWKESHRKSQFVAVDGEGENTADGQDHLYTLLCNSRGQAIESAAGLDFQRCADFLIETAKSNPLANIVAYSFNYDVQMMVKSLPKENILELWHEHKTRWRQYFMEWIPSKFFTIVRGRRDKTSHKRNQESVTVWDTFGFFQMSFYNTILQWEVATKEEADAILGMKQQRGNFSNVEKEQIKKYCFQECDLLERLCIRLADSFRRVEIPLRRYDGAGAAAAGLMQRNQVSDYLTRDREVESLALRAYFGGRVELFRIGEYPIVHTWDINSAYPYALTKLPSLVGGRWKRAEYQAGVDYAIWHVKWLCESNEPLSPFPYRDSTGRIRYVHAASGWYHSVEVDAAKALFGDRILPEWGYVFDPATDTKPFAFLVQLYAERQRRKASHDVSQLPMKLSMNGISGKLAQGRGYNGRVPKYQCFYWAGLVTATTRAAILASAYPVRDALVGIATDGVFALRQNEALPYSTALGGFERGTYLDYFSAQAGVYCAWKENGVYDAGNYHCDFHGRNRGFTTREINWQDLREQYRRNGIGAISIYRPTRFVSIGGSLPNLEYFGTWRERERKLSIGFGGKVPHPTDDGWMQNRQHPQYGVLYPGLPEQEESQPYTPKSKGWLDMPENELEAMLELLEEW